MARFTKERLAKRDDPIYREGLTISTPISGRVSTPSTPNLPNKRDKPTAPASPRQKPKAGPQDPQQE